jgi:hypothetical protein
MAMQYADEHGRTGKIARAAIGAQQQGGDVRNASPVHPSGVSYRPALSMPEA